MATSSSYDFDVTTNDIIEMAFKVINVLPEGQTLSNEQYDTGKKMLNMMVKLWRAKGVFLWKQDNITVALTASSKVRGTDNIDYECIRNHTAAAENKPITGAKYKTYWKKLTTAAASSWVSGTAYTNIGQVSLDTNIISLDDGMVRDTGDEINTQIHKITRTEYLNRFDSNNSGKPIQYYFKRETTPQLYIHPIPDSATDYVLEFVANTFPEDFDSSNNNPDFFQEWHEPLVLGLAERLALQNGVTGQELKDIQTRAFRSYEEAKYIDNESGGLQFSPQLR